MANMVTMDLREYDKMQEEIYSLKEQIKQMEEYRIKELKEIFKLRENIHDIDVKIDYGNIIKELYGEEIKIDDRVYKIDNNKEFANIEYNIWLVTDEEA